MIRIICPQDPTIRCVERQAGKLNRRLDKASKKYIVKPNDGSKFRCHQLIKSWSEDDLIIFMGHGRSDALFGSRGKMFNIMGGDNAKDRDTDDIYNDESFVDESNYGLFAGKSVVCFTCESDELGKKLMESGAKAIVGFGKMPSSKIELEQDAHVKYSTKTMVAYINGALNVAFREAVLRAHRMKGVIEDVAIYFKMEMRRQVSLLLHSKAKYRYCMANVLYDIARTVTVMGDKKLKV